MRVRPATAGDLEEIVALERATETAPHWNLEEYAAMVRDAAEESAVRRRLLVAEERGGVAGFAVGRLVAEVGEVESVAVRAELRRRGAGRALLEALLAWCDAAGARSVELEVRSRSMEARRLYTRLGFGAVGLRPRYYGRPDDDAVVMRRKAGRGEAGDG